MKSIFEKPYRFCPNCKVLLKRKLIDKQKLLFCPRCNFIFWNNPKPVVSIILYNFNKILMLQRANKPFKGYWCLPGGFINYQEKPEEAILREVKEEVGIDPQIKNLVGVYRIDNDPRGINIDIIYHGKISGKVLLSDEHSKYSFFSPQKLPKKIAYKHRKAINDWLKTKQKGG